MAIIVRYDEKMVYNAFIVELPSHYSPVRHEANGITPFILKQMCGERAVLLPRSVIILKFRLDETSEQNRVYRKISLPSKTHLSIGAGRLFVEQSNVYEMEVRGFRLRNVITVGFTIYCSLHCYIFRSYDHLQGEICLSEITLVTTIRTLVTVMSGKFQALAALPPGYLPGTIVEKSVWAPKPVWRMGTGEPFFTSATQTQPPPPYSSV
jgi:hypothetical protein